MVVQGLKQLGFFYTKRPLAHFQGFSGYGKIILCFNGSPLKSCLPLIAGCKILQDLELSDGDLQLKNQHSQQSPSE